MSSYISLVILVICITAAGAANNYPVTDAGQTSCYDENNAVISCSDYPVLQDAGYSGLAQSFCDNGDGTVTDMATGLMWTKEVYGEMNATEAHKSVTIAGYSDWRLPTIKEIYSLSDFDGQTGTSENNSIPYTNDVFDVEYGTSRYIDGQLWSSTMYVDTVFNGVTCYFGHNVIDGRIKCYEKDLFLRYVRGTTSIGINSFVVNADNTIVTDEATGLQWMVEDSGDYGAGPYGDGSMDWPDALTFCNNLTLGGYSDWRLPDAHALQSIVDYTRSPGTTDSAAIDPIFSATSIINEAGEADYGWYWTSDTHLEGNIGRAAYIAFGRATGNMSLTDGSYKVMDVHGAGAQRSDPKVGPNPYPYGHGPQGDMLRIYNYVRCVRGDSTASADAPATCNTTTPSPTTPPTTPAPTTPPPTVPTPPPVTPPTPPPVSPPTPPPVSPPTPAPKTAPPANKTAKRASQQNSLRGS